MAVDLPVKATLPRFPFSKYGPKVDPVGEYVRLDQCGRTYLGEIKRVWYDGVCGTIRCEVMHFNGEPWPFEPSLSALYWIKQD